jgi:hypothetical protein
MNILSVDVGIKNLAYCLLHLPQGAEVLTPKSAMKTLKIVKWDTLNLCKTTEVANLWRNTQKRWNRFQSIIATSIHNHADTKCQ